MALSTAERLTADGFNPPLKRCYSLTLSLLLAANISAAFLPKHLDVSLLIVSSSQPPGEGERGGFGKYHTIYNAAVITFKATPCGFSTLKL